MQEMMEKRPCEFQRITPTLAQKYVILVYAVKL